MPVNLIAAVRLKENGCIGTKSLNTNGTYDLGPMQINSWWFEDHSRSLSKLGITARSVQFDFCQNIAVGTYILRKNYDSYGNNWADAISAYNLGRPKRDSKYLRGVLLNLERVNHSEIQICGEKYEYLK